MSAAIPHVHSAERRAQMEATTAQIEAYGEQKKLAQDTAAANEAQRNEERKSISQKSLRSRRRAFARAGFLSDANASGGEKGTLG